MNNYRYDITKQNFELVDPADNDEWIKVISRYKSGELFDYITAYYNGAGYWVITYIKDLNPAVLDYNPNESNENLITRIGIYFGLIPNDEFGDQLFINTINF